MKTKSPQYKETDHSTGPLSPMRWTGHALWTALLALTVVALIGVASAPAQPLSPDIGGKKNFTFFQANAYIGADLESLLTLNPTDPDFQTQLTQLVSQIFGSIVASNPPVRMAGLAHEIASAKPDVVGLEEMVRLETAPATPQGPGTFTVQYDFLDLLMNALADQGAHYRVAAVAPETDITLPFVDPTTQLPAYARALDRNVILVRTDLPPGFLHVSNPQNAKYAARISFPEVGAALERSWCSVDIFSRGQSFRVICTHLEVEAAIPIQAAQAQELLAGPANVDMPVVLIGDFNTDPLQRDGSPTYGLFGQAGFQDVWTTLNPDDPTGGLTWGHDPALANPSMPFVYRIDLVLYRGPSFVPTSVQVVDMELDRTTPPLWPSDHAAVAASFDLLNEKDFIAAGKVAGKFALAEL